jgi:hypothetical protein
MGFSSGFASATSGFFSTGGASSFFSSPSLGFSSTAFFGLFFTLREEKSG